MSITPLTGSDTFKTWFDRTNSLITSVNGITVFDVKGNTGINVSVVGGVASVSNIGVLNVTAGSTGILVTTSSGTSTIFNTGVWSVNGSTGDVTVSGSGPGGDFVSSFNSATGGVTGVVSIIAGTGIGLGANQVNVTVSNRGVLSLNGLTGAVNGVSSFNGLTGAVSGVTTSVANTFTALQTFDGGLSASGGTFGFISAPNVVFTTSPNTFTALQTFNSGISANTGVTFNSDIRVNFLTIGRGGGDIDSNTSVGLDSLRGNTSGINNTSVGRDSLKVNTNFGNTSVGAFSLRSNITGNRNTSVGFNSLAGNTTGSLNTSVGVYSLQVNTTGWSNTSVGVSSLEKNSTGQSNTSVGLDSLRGNTTGSFNTSVGISSLRENTTGSFNTSLGGSAGRYRGTGTDGLTSATRGIFIGHEARASADNQTNEIVIGSDALGMGSNTAVIGATLQSAAFIYGVVNALGGVSAPGLVKTVNAIAPDSNGNITVSVSGGEGSGITWTVVTTNQGLTANTGIFAAPGSGVLGLTLPTSGAEIGSIIRISGISGGWRVGQGAAQQIYFGNLNTTLGTGGYIESTHPRDTVELICYNPNTLWNITSSIGNIGVV